MVATSAIVARAPVTEQSWPRIERAALEQRLRALGTGITELSDAREWLGLPRLSDATPEARRLARHLLAGRRGRGALLAVRAEREALTEQFSRISRDLIGEARADLGVRVAAPTSMRLGELRAVVARAIEIWRSHPSEPVLQPRRRMR